MSSKGIFFLIQLRECKSYSAEQRITNLFTRYTNLTICILTIVVPHWTNHVCVSVTFVYHLSIKWQSRDPSLYIRCVKVIQVLSLIALLVTSTKVQLLTQKAIHRRFFSRAILSMTDTQCLVNYQEVDNGSTLLRVVTKTEITTKRSKRACGRQFVYYLLTHVRRQ